MFKLNGKLGRLLLNLSPSLLLMMQSHVQHMQKKMTYLLWRDGTDSEALLTTFAPMGCTDFAKIIPLFFPWIFDNIIQGLQRSDTTCFQ